MLAGLDPCVLFVAGQRPNGPWRISLAAGDLDAAWKAVKVWEQGNTARLRHEIAAAVLCDGRLNGDRAKDAAAKAAAGLRHDLKEPWFLLREADLGRFLQGAASVAGARAWCNDDWCHRVEAMVAAELE